MKRPNVLFVFGDQWRQQATGFAGDPNVRTPCLDALAQESIVFTNAVGGCPVCSPYRASLLTGRYPLTHGVFVNDVHLNHDAVGLGDAFAAQGYDTAYIGKWHVDGRGRSAFIPREDRQGFDYWKALECTHAYDRSAYYAGDSDQKLFWEGYDAAAQTDDAIAYLRARRAGDRPFLLVLSWGPPHSPYAKAPAEFQALYRSEDLRLRPNVPEAMAAQVRRDLVGYYGHCSALDVCLDRLLKTLRETGLEENTLLVFTSDHGDMIGCQGVETHKQGPWDESIRVPFLLRFPARFGRRARSVAAPINAPDLMPTLLGLAGCPIPDTVEGLDFSGYLDGGPDPSNGETLIACYHPFADFWHGRGGREYRGLRTERYTYVRDVNGPWLLFDNASDPYQQINLVGRPEYGALQQDLENRLQATLKAQGDAFLPGLEYMRRFGYPMDDKETVPFQW
jgi:arylsulfatase A-like enzyme